MKPNWNKPWDSGGGEIGRLTSPFRKVAKAVGKQLSKKKRKKRAPRQEKK